MKCRDCPVQLMVIEEDGGRCGVCERGLEAAVRGNATPKQGNATVMPRKPSNNGGQGSIQTTAGRSTGTGSGGDGHEETLA